MYNVTRLSCTRSSAVAMILVYVYMFFLPKKLKNKTKITVLAALEHDRKGHVTSTHKVMR